MRVRVVYVDQVSNQDVVSYLHIVLRPEITAFSHEAVVPQSQSRARSNNSKRPQYTTVRADLQICWLTYIRQVRTSTEQHGRVKLCYSLPLLGMILRMHALQVVQA